MHPSDRYRLTNVLRAEAQPGPLRPPPVDVGAIREELSRPLRYAGRTSIGPWRGRGELWEDRRYAAEPPRRVEDLPMSYAGKGPKGYVRRDARIHEDACEALTRDPDVDATGIEVRVDQGEVWLTGEVDGTHERWLAEGCVRDLPGVRYVHNRLRVRSSAVWLTGGR